MLLTQLRGGQIFFCQLIQIWYKITPHTTYIKVSYIQITKCHRHIIRKTLFLVEENTVTTIPKLLFGVSEVHRKNPASFRKITSGGPGKALRNRCTVYTGAVTTTGHKETLHYEGVAEAHSPGRALVIRRGPSRLESKRPSPLSFCSEGSGCFFL